MKKFLVIIGVISEFLCASKEGILDVGVDGNTYNVGFKLHGEVVNYFSTSVAVRQFSILLVTKKHVVNKDLLYTDLEYQLGEVLYKRDYVSAIVLPGIKQEDLFGHAQNIVTKLFSTGNAWKLVKKERSKLGGKNIYKKFIDITLSDKAKKDLKDELPVCVKTQMLHRSSKDITEIDDISTTFQIVLSSSKSVDTYHRTDTLYPIILQEEDTH